MHTSTTHYKKFHLVVFSALFSTIATNAATLPPLELDEETHSSDKLNERVINTTLQPLSHNELGAIQLMSGLLTIREIIEYIPGVCTGMTASEIIITTAKRLVSRAIVLNKIVYGEEATYNNELNPFSIEFYLKIVDDIRSLNIHLTKNIHGGAMSPIDRCREANFNPHRFTHNF